MKRILVFIAFALALVVGLKASPAVAEGIMVASETMSSVAKDQVVDGSAYLAGESVEVQGTVKGDVYCAAQTVTINGTVDGDVLCAGKTVTVNGVVHGDIRAAGMTISLKGQVDGSVTLAGMNISTDSASRIGRDVTIMANTTDLSGSTGRDAVLAGASVSLNGPIGRDVRIEANSVTVSDVKIGGTLTYASDNEASISSGAVIGAIEHKAATRHPRVSIGLADVILGMFIAVVAFAVLAVLVTLIAPRYVREASDITGAGQFGLYFLIGLVGLVVAPVILLMMLITVVGAYAAFVLGLAVLLAMFIGGVLVAYRLGRFMLDAKARPFVTVLVGSLALGVLSIIPFAGILVVFVAMATGFGMVLMNIKSQHVAVESVSTKPKQATKQQKRQ